MMDETLIPRLIEALHRQLGQLSANVLELQLRLGDATDANAKLAQQVQDQSERIRSDTDLIRTVRDERDRFRVIAEPAPTAKRKTK